MANEDVKITLGGEDVGVQQALNKVTASVNSATAEIKAKFEGLTSVFSRVQGAFIAITAILAGGKAFKAAVEETVNMTKSAQALGKQLGISATDASVLAVALDDVFVTQEQFSAGAGKIAQTLKKNEEAFHQLGVATRDQNGNFRNQLDIQQDVNAKLLQFKEGTDRNVEGIKIYGKAWAEVAPTLKVTREVMEAAALKAASLGLVVGQENVQATQRYRSAMNDVHDVISAVEKAIGDALLPVLSSIGEWFGDNGPALVNIFRASIYALYASFSYLKEGVVLAFDYLQGRLINAVLQVKRFAETAGNYLKLDFAAAKASWAEGTRAIEENARTMALNIKQDMKEAQDARDAFLDRTAPGSQTPTTKPPPGGLTSDGGDAKLKNQMADLEAGLSAEKLYYVQRMQAQGIYQEASKQLELDYWNRQLAGQELTDANRKAITKKALDLQLAIKRDAFQGELAMDKERISEVKGSFDAQIELAKAYFEKIKTAYPEDLKAQADAWKQVVNLERAKNEQIETLRAQSEAVLTDMALAEVDGQQRAAQLQEQLGEITYAQLLEKERDFEDQRYQIRYDALIRAEELEANSTKNPEKLAAINAQIEELELAHQGRLQEIQARTALESRRHWTDTFHAMQSGFQSVIGNFLKGTLTFKGFVQGMFSAVLDAITNTLAAMAAQWLTTTIMQMITGKATSSSIITGHAAEAGAAAVASTAAIPIVGPFLAPAAGLAAFGQAMAYQAVAASAAGGYDIPAGVNPVVQAHAREMVLPEKHADVIRSLADRAEGNGQGGRSALHFHISALDGKSVRKLLMDEKGTIAQALKNHARGAGLNVPSH